MKRKKNIFLGKDEKYTLEDIGKLTRDVSAEQVKGHFNRAIRKRRTRNGRYR